MSGKRDNGKTGKCENGPMDGGHRADAGALIIPPPLCSGSMPNHSRSPFSLSRFPVFPFPTPAFYRCPAKLAFPKNRVLVDCARGALP